MKFIYLFSLLLAFNVSAQEIKDLNVIVDSRDDNITETDVKRLQGRVRVGFTVDLNGVVEIVGLASSGSSFNNDWNTFVSNNDSNEDLRLAFRNLYLRKVIGKTSVELGALSPEPTVGAAGLAPSGWMDGLRVKVNTEIGDFKVVAGSLGDFKEPNAFQRKFKGNFIEIEMDRKILDDLLIQTAVENYNGDTYLREGVKLDLSVFGQKVLKVFGEALYDVERDAYNYEVGSELDVLKTITGKLDHRLDLKVFYSHLDADIPDRNSMISAYYTSGQRYTFQLGGKIDKAGNVTWNARAALGEDGKNRYDAGLSVKISAKKKKK